MATPPLLFEIKNAEGAAAQLANPPPLFFVQFANPTDGREACEKKFKDLKVLNLLALLVQKYKYSRSSSSSLI